MKSPSKEAAGTAGGNRGMLVLIFFLVIFLVAMVAVYGYVAVKDRHDAEYVSIVGNLQVLSQRITTSASQVTQGREEAFDLLARHHREFDRNLELLRAGNPDTGMPASPEGVSEPLGALSAKWKVFGGNIQTVLSRRETILALRNVVNLINQQANRLLALSDEVAALMAQSGAPTDQVYLASRQLMLSQRIVNNVNRVLTGDEGSVTAADRFGRDAALFGRVINGMLKGNAELGIARVRDAQVRAKLAEVEKLFGEIGQQLGSILERTPEMFQVSEAVHEIMGTSDGLLRGIAELDARYKAYVATRPLNIALGNGFGLVALLLLIYMGYRLRRDGMQRLEAAEAQRRASEEQNRRNQQAIMRLLDEMADLADGDLTVNATVTEDITGAIADSINYAIDALRRLVTAINDTAAAVSTGAQGTQGTAKQLAEAADYQTQEIATASNAVRQMAESIEGVSENADELAEKARTSVEIAKMGANTVRRTIQGMDTIREQIQETSKRIKRLGESSQEIGDIVELINDIAEQTNILALNAAIQAAMAGEAGRGFAVVADEVQRLAERSADATKQIEALVRTIQSDTNEAVASMEQSTSNVVAGARLAEDAGTALAEIESVAMHLSELIQHISEATRQQAMVAGNVSETMNVIREITSQTSVGTKQTADSIGNVAQLTDDLKRSVAGFKLP